MSCSNVWIAASVMLAGIGLPTEGTRGADADGGAPITFTEHVAPIMYRHCASCHREGEGTPFELWTYRDVRKRGRLIQQVTADHLMPPWPPSEGWGHFQDERRLSEAELDVIDRWVGGGMAEGPAEALPERPKFPSGGWRLGTPDLVVTVPEAFEVPADGPDLYRMFVLPLDLPEDRWVTAVEIQPTARTVVHHALYFLDSTGGCRDLDAQDPEPGFGKAGGGGMRFPRTGTLGGWAVGATPRHLPMGLGYPLPRGSDLVLQVHFHPSGKAERERTSLGLYFAKAKPQRSLLGIQAPLAFGLGTELRTRGIAPGEKDFTIRGEWTAPFDIEVVSVGGHAHYLCRTMQATASLPDGTEEKLFAIDDWDFNWQGRYNYGEPVWLPKGTVIRTTLTYDNSAGNPRNPSNPPVHVRWGEGSTDEMGSIGFAFVAANEAELKAYRGSTFFLGGDQIGRNPAAALRLMRDLGGLSAVREAGIPLDRLAGLDAATLRRRLEARDADGDGRLKGEEIPSWMRPMVGRIDGNGDGALDREELRKSFQGLRSAGPAPSEGTSPATDEGARPTDGGQSADARTGAPVGPALIDLDGREWSPFTPAPGTPARVLLFTTQDCPIANQYAPEVGRLAREYAGRGVEFLLVEVDPDRTPDEVRRHAEEYGLVLPLAIDAEHRLVKAAGVKTTPEAVVVRPDGTMAYSGRIDDRFGRLGRQRPEPSRRDLKEALEAVLAGKTPTPARVEALGCPIEDRSRVPVR